MKDEPDEVMRIDVDSIPTYNDKDWRRLQNRVAHLEGCLEQANRHSAWLADVLSSERGEFLRWHAETVGKWMPVGGKEHPPRSRCEWWDGGVSAERKRIRERLIALRKEHYGHEVALPRAIDDVIAELLPGG